MVTLLGPGASREEDQGLGQEWKGNWRGGDGCQ